MNIPDLFPFLCLTYKLYFIHAVSSAALGLNTSWSVCCIQSVVYRKKVFWLWLLL